LVRTAGFSSAPADALALFSGMSQKAVGRAAALVFSFVPLYFLEGEPLVFVVWPRSPSSVRDSEFPAPSSSELLSDEARLSSAAQSPPLSSFLGEPPGSQSALRVFLVLALVGLFRDPSDFLFLVAFSPSGSGWLRLFPSFPSEPSGLTGSWFFPDSDGGLASSDRLPVSQRSDGLWGSDGPLRWPRR
jgi:hypothetical protein